MGTQSIRLETPRLILREFEHSDLEDVFEFATNPEVSRYTGDAGECQTRDDAAKIITDVWHRDYRVHGFGRLAVEHKTDRKVIGFCGLKFLEDMQVVDIGYRLLPSYWGKGIATEAAQATMNWSRERSMKGIIGLVLPYLHPHEHGAACMLYLLRFYKGVLPIAYWKMLTKIYG